MLTLLLVAALFVAACGGGGGDDDGAALGTPGNEGAGGDDPRLQSAPDLASDTGRAGLEEGVRRLWVGIGRADAVAVWQRLNSACRYDTSLADVAPLLTVAHIYQDDFEDVADLWSGTLGAEVSRSIEQANSGDVSLLVRAGDDPWGSIRTAPFPFEPEQNYVLEVTLRGSGNDVPMYVSVAEPQATEPLGWLSVAPDDTEWVAYRLSFQAPEDSGEMVISIGKENQVRQASFFVDDVALRASRPFEEIEIEDLEVEEQEGAIAFVRYSVLADGERLVDADEMDPQELIWDEAGWRLRDCPGS